MRRGLIPLVGAIVWVAVLATCNGPDEAVPPDANDDASQPDGPVPDAIADAMPDDGAIPDAPTDAMPDDGAIPDAPTDAMLADGGIPDAALVDGNVTDASVDAAVACSNPDDVCANGIQDGMETDVDCGGPSYMGCRRCDNGQDCSTDLDCTSALCNQGVCAPYSVVLGYVACSSNGDCGGNGICSSTTGTGYCRWTCTSAVHCQQLFGPENQGMVVPGPGSPNDISCEGDLFPSLLSHCRYDRPTCNSCWDDCNGVDDDGDRLVDEGWFDFGSFEMVLCRNGGDCIDGRCLLQCP
jgi:hypothetical protein